MPVRVEKSVDDGKMNTRDFDLYLGMKRVNGSAKEVRNKAMCPTLHSTVIRLKTGVSMSLRQVTAPHGKPSGFTTGRCMKVWILKRSTFHWKHAAAQNR